MDPVPSRAFLVSQWCFRRGRTQTSGLTREQLVGCPPPASSSPLVLSTPTSSLLSLRRLLAVAVTLGRGSRTEARPYPPVGRHAPITTPTRGGLPQLPLPQSVQSPGIPMGELDGYRLPLRACPGNLGFAGWDLEVEAAKRSAQHTWGRWPGRSEIDAHVL